MAASTSAADTGEAENEEIDESLDFSSDKFDPLKALSSDNVKVPRPKAPLLDNLAKYESGLKRQVKPPTDKAERVLTNREKAQLHAELTKQRFQNIQLPEKRPSTYHEKNIFTWEERENGPLSALKSSLEKKLRVKVITRGCSGIRGYCIGFVEAFDKQWNLVLTDVIEVWTRRRKKKIPAGIEDLAFEQLNLGDNQPDIPQIKITPKDKSTEMCERHIQQFMMRGEHIVMIILLDKS